MTASFPAYLSEDSTIKRDYREEAHRAAERRQAAKSEGSVRRPTPRRKSRPRRIVGIWARVSLLLVFIGVLGVMAVHIVIKIVRPYREAGVQTMQLDGTRAQVALLDQQNADLRHQITYLRTGGGMVDEARKNGYVRPGEIPFVVEGMMPSSSLSVLQTSKHVAPAVPRSRTARLWHRLTGR